MAKAVLSASEEMKKALQSVKVPLYHLSYYVHLLCIYHYNSTFTVFKF